MYATKVKDKKIVQVDEHNLDEFAQYLELRRGVKDAKKLLESYMPSGDDKYSDPAYIAKVKKIAAAKGIGTKGKTVKEVVEEIKALG